MRWGLALPCLALPGRREGESGMGQWPLSEMGPFLALSCQGDPRGKWDGALENGLDRTLAEREGNEKGIGIITGARTHWNSFFSLQKWMGGGGGKML